jgi:phosphotriesterase-related protein
LTDAGGASTRASGHVTTVLGEIDPGEIGPTLMHEHVFLDSGDTWWDPTGLDPPELATAPLSIQTAGIGRWHAVAIRDNLKLDHADLDAQVQEVAAFRDAGGSCLVDLTNDGLGPAPGELRALANALGLHVVAGCGFYLHATHPAWVEDASRIELEDHIERELVEGIAGTDVRAGIIGEIGTSETLYPCERRVLQAAASVGARLGTLVNVHTTVSGTAALEIIEVAAGAGLSPDRLYLSHVEERLDPAYNLAILKTGAVIGFDSFGCDVYYDRHVKSPSDLEKLRALVAVLEAGFEDQVVLGHDTGMKVQLKRYGGMGYDHVIRRIAPTLRSEFGATEATVEKLLVANPRRLLAQRANPETATH